MDAYKNRKKTKDNVGVCLIHSSLVAQNRKLKASLLHVLNVYCSTLRHLTGVWASVCPTSYFFCFGYTCRFQWSLTHFKALEKLLSSHLLGIKSWPASKAFLRNNNIESLNLLSGPCQLASLSFEAKKGYIGLGGKSKHSCCCTDQMRHVMCKAFGGWSFPSWKTPQGLRGLQIPFPFPEFRKQWPVSFNRQR